MEGYQRMTMKGRRTVTTQKHNQPRGGQTEYRARRWSVTTAALIAIAITIIEPIGPSTSIARASTVCSSEAMQDQFWTGNMTVGTGQAIGFSEFGNFGTLDNKTGTYETPYTTRTFTIGGVLQGRMESGVMRSGSTNVNRMFLVMANQSGFGSRSGIVLHVGDDQYAMNESAGTFGQHTYDWPIGTRSTLTAGATVCLALTNSTPLPAPTAPLEPTSLGATPNDRQVTLTWTKSAYNGRSAILHYQYQHKSGDGAFGDQGVLTLT